MRIKAKVDFIDYILVVIANLAFALIFIFGYYRFEWFGILPGYAPHNFGFNFLLIIPLTFISFACSVFVVIRILCNWKIRTNKLNKYFSILFSLPGILLTLRIFMVLILNIFSPTNYY